MKQSRNKMLLLLQEDQADSNTLITAFSVDPFIDLFMLFLDHCSSISHTFHQSVAIISFVQFSGVRHLCNPPGEKKQKYAFVMFKFFFV